MTVTTPGSGEDAIEEGTLLDSDSVTAFRRRVSGTPSESAADDSGGYGTGEPMEVSWTMKPGRGYTFNVGQWVFAERHPGTGGAGAIAQVQGTVILMTVFR